jgi:hypothetical protein
MFLIDAKSYRCAFEELCTTRQCFDAQALHSETRANDTDVSSFAVFEIPPAPRFGHEPYVPLAGCSLHASRLGPTPKLPTQNSFIHFSGAAVPVPSPIDLKRSSTVPAEASRSWDDDPADVSTCDGDAASDVEASDDEISAIAHLPSSADSPTPHWQAQQLIGEPVDVNTWDVNTWGAPVWPSQCTVEANLAMAAWAQQFCLPGFSVQMMGFVPLDADRHSLHARKPRPFVAADTVEVPAPAAVEQQQTPSGGERESCCFVFQHMASSLRTMDTSIVKKCNLDVGNFTITIAPKRATLKKSGSSFRASKGQCTAQVKCNSATKREFALSLGLGNAPALVTVRHDFSKHPVCSIPGVLDLKTALDEAASLFRLTFEFTVV